MTQYLKWVWLSVLIVAGLNLISTVPEAQAATRVRGSLGFQGYGYETAEDNDHLWLFQSTRFSIYHSTSPLSFHFSGGYLGDQEDDFSSSGQARFLKGYLEWGRFTDDLHFRLGRSYIFQGVANGVLDGVSVDKKLGSAYRLSAFGGMMGHRSRKFEFETFDQALALGTQLDWTPKKLWKFDKTKLSLSYAYQTRYSEAYRHRIGLTGAARLNSNLNLLTVLQVRPTGSPLRKFVGRVRYSAPDLTGLLELGIYTSELAEASWFSDFELPTRIRLRFAFDKYLVPAKWGFGLEGLTVLVNNGSAFRFGPVLQTPIGQVGYRMQQGDLSKSDGPWANLRYAPIKGLEVFASAAMTTYEWEDFEIAEEDLITVQAGGRYTPQFYPQLTISGEYQVYQSPRFTSDRRFMGGFTWKFDTGRAGK